MATLTRSDNPFLPLASFLSWASQLTSWTYVSDSGDGASVTVQNSDGTFTVFTSADNSIGLDGGNNPVGGNISQVERFDTDGLTLIETLVPDADFSLAVFYINIATTSIDGLLSGADNIIGGSSSHDNLFGYDGDDTFNPGPLDLLNGPAIDVMIGGKGNDTFNVGPAPEVAFLYVIGYNQEDGGSGVVINLSDTLQGGVAAHSATDTFGDTDTLNGIINVVGTNQADQFFGGAISELFNAGGGADTIDGGGDGQDFDLLVYSFIAAVKTDVFNYDGITVTFNVAGGGTLSTSGQVVGTVSGTDTFSDIERVLGTNVGDTFNGANDSFNTYVGMGGNDIFNGGDFIDLADYAFENISGATGGVIVNLSSATQFGVAAGKAADSLGGTDTLNSIEWVSGTNAADILIGGSGDNDLSGHDGADLLVGGAGNDSFSGDGATGQIYADVVDYGLETGGGAITVNADGTVKDTFGNTDTLFGIGEIRGTALGDTFNGSKFNDSFAPGKGNDVISSGGSFVGAASADRVSYNADDAATSGVNYDAALLTQQVKSTYYGNDTLTGFTNIWFEATQFADSIKATEGDDILLPSLGSDTIDGRGGFDYLTYIDRRSTNLGVGITVTATTATSGTVVQGVDTDTYTNIEHVDGSFNADTFNGSSGNDSFSGFSGGDTFDGNGGSDTLSYEFDEVFGAKAGIDVDLTLGTVLNGYGATDALSEIENIVGTSFADILLGDTNDNSFDGRGGADIMTGGDGNDTYFVDNALDQVVEDGTGTADVIRSSIDFNLAVSGDNVENLVLDGKGNINGTGNGLANSIIGNSGNNIINGGTGADKMDGGAGNDTFFVDVAGDTVSDSAGIDTINSLVTITLATGLENLLLGGGGIANGTGNAVNNIMTGNTANNSLSGLGGSDTLSGGSGVDKLIGGAGRDTMTGGAANDVFDFNLVTETGKTASTRDIIKDFTHLGDDIDLSTIDANGTAAGNGVFSFQAAKGAAFTGVKGQLHWTQFNAAGTINDKTIIEGDINGDKVADFQIELTGLKTLTAADFVL